MSKLTPTQKSAERKRQIELGRSIAAALPEKMTATECAKRLGISITAVLKIERIALAKVHDGLKAAIARETANI